MPKHYTLRVPRQQAQAVLRILTEFDRRVCTREEIELRADLERQLRRQLPKPRSSAAVRKRADEILADWGWAGTRGDPDFNYIGGGGIVGRAIAQAKRELETAAAGS